MIGDYENILKSLSTATSQIGFAVAVNDDFYAELVDQSGRTIVVTGDKSSYPAFSLLISPSKTGERRRLYAVWLLMRALGDQIPADRRVPKVENQIWFVENCSRIIFDNESSYRKEYERINFEG